MFRKLLRLMPYVRQHRVKLVAIVVMTLAASMTSVLQPWPMKVLVDYALGEIAVPDWLRTSFSFFGLTSSPFLLILLAGLLSLCLFVLSAALDVGLSWAWMATGQRMVYELAADVFSHLQRLSLRYHSRSSVGDKLDRLTTDTWCVYSIVSDLLVKPIQCGCTIVGVGMVAWLLDPWLTILSFAVSPVLAISVRFFGGRLKRGAKKSREAHAR